MSESSSNKSQSVIFQLDAIGEGVDDMDRTIEFLEKHTFFDNLESEHEQVKEGVRDAITNLLYDNEAMDRKSVKENNIEERLKALLEKMKAETSTADSTFNEDKGNLDSSDVQAEFYKDLIDGSHGQIKAFYTAIKDHTKSNLEEGNLFVKIINVLKKNEENEPETLELQMSLKDLVYNFIEDGDFRPRFLKAFFGALDSYKWDIEKALLVKITTAPLPIPVTTESEPANSQISVELSEVNYLKFLSDYCEMNLDAEDADKFEEELRKVEALLNLELTTPINPKDERLLRGIKDNISTAIKLIMRDYPNPDELNKQSLRKKEETAKKLKSAIQEQIIELAIEKTIPKFSEKTQKAYREVAGQENEEYFTFGELDEDEDEEKRDEEDENVDDSPVLPIDHNKPNKTKNKTMNAIVINLLRNRLKNKEEVSKWEPACALIADLIAENNADIEMLNKYLACPDDLIQVNQKNSQLVESAKKMRRIKNNEQLLDILSRELEENAKKLKEMNKGAGPERNLAEKTKTRLIKLISNTKKLLVQKHKNMRYESPFELLKAVYNYIKPEESENSEQQLELLLEKKKAEMPRYQPGKIIHSAKSRFKKLTSKQ